ncbi:hypothetical protein MIND_01094600 [Mycena indigotica]|uniref:F-box domain-containing protein n=1 Tax=Mycena indigotica TaxID=2126181 RepID=A0A8H6VXI6_9AGAR|nr:uncharacterized protein MIND_01094600 [Mycena indigotica]KAF7295546.1 hypothetical protein MIND_01094600 [Mycena indigotica]
MIPLEFLWRFWSRLWLWKGINPPISLVSLPTDILAVIFDYLEVGETRIESPHINLLSLSLTCRKLRVAILPRVFRKICSHSASCESVWPKSLWPFFRTLRLRDEDTRTPVLSPELLDVLSALPAVTKIVLSTESVIPTDFFSAVAGLGTLQVLELRQLRLDGETPSMPLPFPSLTNLILSIVGPRGATRVSGIDVDCEKQNVASLLKNLAPRLERLTISGDLLSPSICDTLWPKLRELVVTEHTPIPYIATHRLLAHMPALHSLSLLYTADVSRDKTVGLHPPLTLGTSHDMLTTYSPHLTAVTLSNTSLHDPIFDQLPLTLDSLSILPMWDLHGHLAYPGGLGEVRFFRDRASELLRRLVRFNYLTEFTFVAMVVNPKPAFVDLIATSFPLLQTLHLGQRVFREFDTYLIEMNDSHFIASLGNLPALRHLKFSLDIYYPAADRGAPATAAWLLLKQLPNLQTVSYRWRHYSISPRSGIWYSWDRSILLQPIPPQLPLKLPRRDDIAIRT